MSTGTSPARSTPQLDLMRRLRVRNGQHDSVAMPFLEEEERNRLDKIINESVSKGVTDTVMRQAHDFLVGLGERDATVRFLTEDERHALHSLTKLDSSTPINNKQKRKTKSDKRMSSGEFLVTISVIASVAAAGYFTYADPIFASSSFWVACWGVLSGGSFIRHTRHRSATENGAISAVEGLLAATVWGVAAAAVVLLGGDQLSPGWAALWSFIGAGAVGRSILKIEDDQ